MKTFELKLPYSGASTVITNIRDENQAIEVLSSVDRELLLADKVDHLQLEFDTQEFYRVILEGNILHTTDNDFSFTLGDEEECEDSLLKLPFSGFLNAIVEADSEQEAIDLIYSTPFDELDDHPQISIAENMYEYTKHIVSGSIFNGLLNRFSIQEIEE